MPEDTDCKYTMVTISDDSGRCLKSKVPAEHWTALWQELIREVGKGLSLEPQYIELSVRDDKGK